VLHETVVSHFDQMQEQALELGHRNAAAIELVRKHCANARVEHDPLGGIGTLEQMTALFTAVYRREPRSEVARPISSTTASLPS